MGLQPDETNQKDGLKEFFEQSFSAPVDHWTLVVDAGNLQKQRDEQATLAKQVAKLEKKIANACCSNWIDSLYLKYLQYKFKSNQKSIEERFAKKHFKCTGEAFVCFQKERDKQKVVNHYASWLACCTSFRYRGRRIKVKSATDPDDIIYENFEYRQCNKFLRRCLSVLVTLIAVVIATGSAFGLEYLRLSLGKNTSLATAIQTGKWRNEILVNFAITIAMNIISLVCSNILIGK